MKNIISGLLSPPHIMKMNKISSCCADGTLKNPDVTCLSPSSIPVTLDNQLTVNSFHYECFVGRNVFQRKRSVFPEVKKKM